MKGPAAGGAGGSRRGGGRAGAGPPRGGRRGAPLAGFQPLFGVGEGGAVVGGEDEDADAVGAVAVQSLADGDDVAQGLAHLLLVEEEPAVVEPVADKGLDAG